MKAPTSERAMRIGYECCAHLRSRGVTYAEAAADPLIARLLRRTGEAYLASRRAQSAPEPQADPMDDPRGMAWWNRLSPAQRRRSIQEVRHAAH
ncbi:hypothetical protein [Thioalkalivibrio sp. ALJ8]|uniref:hypothetical protein n=1 Tax=Thioalkalivibrio sp. ALJ8 TaxID=1158757 RepID=UPI000363DCD4|nr:hypothetical protein [Thioalkalivibrio sp. ALJ8]